MSVDLTYGFKTWHKNKEIFREVADDVSNLIKNSFNENKNLNIKHHIQNLGILVIVESKDDVIEFLNRILVNLKEEGYNEIVETILDNPDIINIRVINEELENIILSKNCVGGCDYKNVFNTVLFNYPLTDRVINKVSKLATTGLVTINRIDLNPNDSFTDSASGIFIKLNSILILKVINRFLKYNSLGFELDDYCISVPKDISLKNFELILDYLLFGYSVNDFSESRFDDEKSMYLLVISFNDIQWSGFKHKYSFSSLDENSGIIKSIGDADENGIRRFVIDTTQGEKIVYINENDKNHEIKGFFLNRALWNVDDL